MLNKMSLTQSQPIKILLDKNAHRYAKQFATQQANPAKGKQVYLNTLAVYAVHKYMKCFPIETTLAQSDCWQPEMRAMFDVADLILPNLGKLECRWLLPEAEVIDIPPEVREDRLGYIVLRFEEELKQAELLGFISGKEINYDTESINLTQLQSLDTLFDTINRLKQQINLRQWLSGFFTSDWQPVETIMAGKIARSLSNNTGIATISRGKEIQWQINSLDEKIILVLKISENSAKDIDLCLQLYPERGKNNLPAGLSVKVLDEAEDTCLSATTKVNDDWIQLEFACQQGEIFKIEMELEGVSMVEKFSL